MTVRALSEEERDCIGSQLLHTIVEFFEERDLSGGVVGDEEGRQFVIRVHGRFSGESLDFDEVAH
jgi:hypothetical protein